MAGEKLLNYNRKRGFLCMTLRGGFMIPLFAGLAFAGASWLAAIPACMAGPAQGPVYSLMRFVKEEWSVMLAEILHGLVIAAALTLTLSFWRG